MKTMFMMLLCILFTTMVVAIPKDIKRAEDINLGETIMSGGDHSIKMMEGLDIKLHPENNFNFEMESDDLLDQDENIMEMNLESLRQFEEQEEGVIGVEEPAKEKEEVEEELTEAERSSGGHTPWVLVGLGVGGGLLALLVLMGAIKHGMCVCVYPFSPEVGLTLVE